MDEDKRITLLVAEDDGEVREPLVELISADFPSLRVIQAYSRDSALAAIELYSPHVVSTDLRMPHDGDGEAVIEAASANGANVIVLSHTVKDLSPKIRKLCFAVLDKPQPIEKISATIRRAICM